ncbi:MAG: hypothetical protein M3405_00180 [Acidobacteriota bacterium]|jgi:hypothetical protein|nr:hypothetical protein [Acidobacteriota bacterium]
MEFWIDVLGWIGALLILTAYALISLKKVEGDSLFYQLLNIVGSIFLVINTYYWKAFPSTLVNVVWAIIAVFAIAVIARKWRKGVKLNAE